MTNLNQTVWQDWYRANLDLSYKIYNRYSKNPQVMARMKNEYCLDFIYKIGVYKDMLIDMLGTPHSSMMLYFLYLYYRDIVLRFSTNKNLFNLWETCSLSQEEEYGSIQQWIDLMTSEYHKCDFKELCKLCIKGDTAMVEDE